MKQLFTLLLLCLLFPVLHCYPQTIGKTAGARSAAMGGASVSLSDFWSIQNNPAGMALQPSLSAGVFYENRFLMKELSLKGAAVVAPTRFGVLGLSFNQFGYTLYNENKFGLAYARSFGKLLRIGLQLDYQTTNIAENYRDASFVTFELGVQSTLNEKLSLGAYVYNPVRMEIADYPDESTPMVMRFGLTYSLTPEFIGVTEIEQNFQTKASLRVGLEYAIQQKFFIRTGISTNPGLLTMGAGIHFRQLQFHIAASMHQILGVTTQAGLVFQFAKKQTNE
ncbi:MAG: hypothetical protein HOO86_07840 [Bacteroidales bacterium]|nr:hypothetical protein [Bacteroidales bacterium]